jgi:hypothetical protein
MVRNSQRLDIAIGLAAVVLLLGTTLALARAAMRARLERIPPALTFPPSKALSYFLICLVVGALTMAFVQIWRTLLPIRGFFQRCALSVFLQNGAASLREGQWENPEREYLRPFFEAGPNSSDAAMFEFEHRKSLNTSFKNPKRFKEPKRW